MRCQSSLLFLLVLVTAVPLVASAQTASAQGAATRPPEPEWTVIALFEGSADTSVRSGLRALLSAALGESQPLRPVGSEQLRALLRLAGRLESQPMDVATARDLAVRSGVSTVIEGRVESAGGRFSIDVRVLRADNGQVLQQAGGSAAGPGDFVAAVDSVARRLRRVAGDVPPEGTADRPLTSVITASYEAFLKYREADRLYGRQEGAAALEAVEQALAIDPDYARAWSLKGHILLTRLGRRADAIAAYNKALSRPERVTPAEREVQLGWLANVQGDFEEALAHYDRAAQLGVRASNNRAIILQGLGRWEEALAERRSVKFPSGVDFIAMYNELFMLGRFEEARDLLPVLDSLRPSEARWRALDLAAADHDWDRLVELGQALYAEAGASLVGQQRWGAYAAGSGLWARGRLREAEDMFRDVRQRLDAEKSWGVVYNHVFGGVVDSWITGSALPMPPEPAVWDTTAWATYARATWLAGAGDTAGVRQQLNALLARPADERRSFGQVPEFLEGIIALKGKNWAEAIRLLGPGAERGYDIGGASWSLAVGVPRPTRQWLVADAYEHAGRPDSAAYYLERVIAPKGFPYEIRTLGYWLPFARFRLGRLYAQLGQRDKAKEHYAALLEMFTQPDPEFAGMVTEARAKVEDLGRGR